jgi:hypothetical protein
LSRTQPSLFTPLGLLRIWLIIFESPWPGQLTMSFWSCNFFQFPSSYWSEC